MIPICVFGLSAEQLDMRVTRPPVLISLALIVIGAVLLLRNFLLIDSAALDPARWWPVLLVAAGAQVLWRGDLAFTWQAQTFGITRGNVQAAVIEIGSGEIDVKIRALRREGRLIAGQYAARSRPDLVVRGGQARLRMQRGQTWLLSLTDWEIGLARDLPWQMLLSAFLGDIDADLRGLQVEQAYLATSFGDVRIIAPETVDIQPVRNGSRLRGGSTFGSVVLTIPDGTAAVVQIDAGRLARTQIDETRFFRREPGVYATLDYDAAVEAGVTPISVHLFGTFGTIRVT
jgi:hypothetical protein